MDGKDITFVGPSCGHHAHYTFYKAIKYVKNGHTSILGLGEFFFVKIWPKSDLLAVGELQLLWEDKNTNQILSSLRLYFLPEYTPEGRLLGHGEDEVISVSEKAVLRVADLLDWIASPKEVNWDRGLLGIFHEDCAPAPPPSTEEAAAAQHNGNGTTTVPTLAPGLRSPRVFPNGSEFMSEVRKEKAAVGDVNGLDDLAVIILSHSQYSRYRSVLKRVAGREKEWMSHPLIVALGGFTTSTRRTYVLFCKDNFDYAELEEHPFLCNHLAPKLKGRPRKRKKPPRSGSPESESASSESSSTSVSITSGYKGSKNGIKRDYVTALIQKNTKEELEFLRKLTVFMDKRNTPIERPPMLGFKQIDLHLFFEKVAKAGGYDGCVQGKAWKSIYDELGGHPQNTSAATCTRRHYEKLLLPFESHLRGLDEQLGLSSQSNLSDQEQSPDKETTGRPNANRRPAVVAASVAVAKNAETSEDDDDFAAEKVSKEKIEEKSEEKSEDSKSNPLLTPAMSKMVEERKEAQVHIDPEGKKLQIDDLIIIPNNVHGPGMGTSGGSALQNLAKIASRYQGTRDEAGSAQVSEQQRSSPKKPRAPSPPKDKNLAAAQKNVQQSSLYNLFPPSLLQCQTLASSPSAKPPAAATNSATMQLAAAAAMMGLPPLGDLSKLGPEGVQMLQMYEKHLTQMAASMAAISGSQYKNGQDRKTPTVEQSQNLSGSGSSSKSPVAASAVSAKDSSSRDDRRKVSKPPPETKRPPSLMQTACAFTQTSSIYSNPLAELNKIRGESKPEAGGQQPVPAAMDLSATMRNRKRPIDSSPIPSPQGKRPPSSGGGGGGTINLKKESSLLKPGAIGSSGQPVASAAANTNAVSSADPASLLASMNMDLAASLKLDPMTMAALQSSPFASQLLSPYLGLGLGGMPVKTESKASPFSAEALMSKPPAGKPPQPTAQSRGPLTPSPNPDYLKSANVAATSPLPPKKHLAPDQQQRYTSPSSSDRRGSTASPAAAYGMNVNHAAAVAARGAASTVASSAYNPPPTGHAMPSPNPADKARGNPWHTPIAQYGSKPQDLKSKDSFQNALLGLAAPPGMPSSASTASTFATTSTSQSLAAALAGLPPSAYAGLSSSAAAAAASNPYLALMGLQGTPPSTKPSALPPTNPASYGALMDPATSAYYAALYSQQMYGLSPYSGLAAAPPQAPQPSGFRHIAPSSTAAAFSGLDPLQASALQAMMAAGGIRTPVTGTGSPGLSAASLGGAGNPFASGNPFAGIAGMPGFGGPFHPGSSRKD